MQGCKRIKNKRPMGHVAHPINYSDNKVSFLESYTKYPDNEVEL